LTSFGQRLGEDPVAITTLLLALDEPGADVPWVLWVLADGWSLAEHSGIAVCPEHQHDPLLKTLRFAG
jgi:hypothetical protein